MSGTLIFVQSQAGFIMLRVSFPSLDVFSTSGPDISDLTLFLPCTSFPLLLVYLLLFAL